MSNYMDLAKDSSKSELPRFTVTLVTGTFDLVATLSVMLSAILSFTLFPGVVYTFNS
jgi:hypothetical protein